MLNVSSKLRQAMARTVKVQIAAKKALTYTSTGVAVYQTAKAAHNFMENKSLENGINVATNFFGIYSPVVGALCGFAQIGVKTKAAHNAFIEDKPTDKFRVDGNGSGEEIIISDEAGNLLKKEYLTKESLEAIREYTKNMMGNLILEIAIDPRISMAKFTRRTTQIAGCLTTIANIISGIEEIGTDIKEDLEMYQNTPDSEKKKGEEISIDESVCQEGDV